jgi:hypothetical protein
MMERELSPVVIRCHSPHLYCVYVPRRTCTAFLAFPRALLSLSLRRSSAFIQPIRASLSDNPCRTQPYLSPSSFSSVTSPILPFLMVPVQSFLHCLPTTSDHPVLSLRSSLRPLVLPPFFPPSLKICPPPPFLDTVRPTASTSSGTKRAQTSTTFSTQSRRAWHHTGQRVSSVSAESSA